MKKIVNKFKNIVDIKLLKFAIVGIVNTVVGTAIMFALYNLAGCSYWISSAANYILTSMLSYFLNKHFTFKFEGDMKGSVIRFALNIALCYLIAYGIAKPITLRLISGSVQFQENIAMIVGMTLFVGFNYLGQRFFVFSGKTKADNDENLNKL